MLLSEPAEKVMKQGTVKKEKIQKQRAATPPSSTSAASWVSIAAPVPFPRGNHLVAARMHPSGRGRRPSC
eukprot:5410573-Prymnesium_polylepis.1